MLAERFNPSRQKALVCRDGCAFLVRRPIVKCYAPGNAAQARVAVRSSSDRPFERPL